MQNLAHDLSRQENTTMRQKSIADKIATVLPDIAERAEQHDREDSFVADNFKLLKEAGLVEAGVPAELGGGGAELPELADMLRRLAHACGSTALAFSMHTHQVAIPAWRTTSDAVPWASSLP